jgi:bifunctional UDP-N-acetylglucosamine pyrophosphorylase/glucosamine-1-phosphate N-acetyltransferase
VTIGPQCFVADSKIEHDVYLGAQVRTSNHRLDKQNVKVLVEGEWVDTGVEKLGCLIGAGSSLGIQVIVLPGRVIAPGSAFAPRITVEKNLPTGRYRVAQQLESY